MSQFTTTLKTLPLARAGKKYFTLHEAHRALPLVKRVAADIQATQALRLRLHSELSAGLAQFSQKKLDMLQDDFDRATRRLESLIEELEKIGVELKDPSRALLDFPAFHQGREVLLCWKAGEETISHWHETDGGMAARKPVTLLHE